jgi:hypothetical protein
VRHPDTGGVEVGSEESHAKAQRPQFLDEENNGKEREEVSRRGAGTQRTAPFCLPVILPPKVLGGPSDKKSIHSAALRLCARKSFEICVICRCNLWISLIFRVSSAR